jgi:mRNA-degrading endonuclease RelE of RelBE toxin-antitoxin system
MSFREVCRLSEFEKDLRRLLKRFKTLEDDLRVFIRTELVAFHKLKKDTKGIFQITDLKIEKPTIFKAKKFACRSLKGKGVQSGIRVIYGYHEDEDRIELVEVYYKGDKENEDGARIWRHYGERQGHL